MSWIDLKSGLRDRSFHLVELECLRGLAIWLVVLFHTCSMAFWRDDGWEGHEVPWPLAFVTAGRTGVTLFFVLSGFLLSLPFLRGAALDRRSVGRFYGARVLRIVPAYYLAVAVAIAYTGEIALGAEALLFRVVGLELFPFNAVWWSLSTEVQFYLLLPLFMFLLRHPAGRVVLVMAGLVWAGAFAASLAVDRGALGDWAEPARNSLFGRLPAFGFGMAVALWYARGRPGAERWLASRWAATAVWVVLVLILGQLLDLATRVGEGMVFRELHWLHGLEALCWALFLAVLVSARPVGAGLLVNSFFAFTGKISYSLFLVHQPILFFMLYPLVSSLEADELLVSPSVWGLSALAIAVSCAVALVTYRWVELPFLRLKERLPAAPRAGDEEVAVASGRV